MGKLPVIYRSNDQFHSDSFNSKQSNGTSNNRNNLNDNSRTSFESLDFVKKIEPQNKYDIQTELNDLERSPNCNSEYFFDMEDYDGTLIEHSYLQTGELYGRPCPTPVQTTNDIRIENLRIDSLLYNDLSKRGAYRNKSDTPRKNLMKPYV